MLIFLSSVVVLMVRGCMYIYMYIGGAFSDVDTTKVWHPTVGIDAKVSKHMCIQMYDISGVYYIFI